MDESTCGSILASNKTILATGGYDHTLKLWQAHTGICYWTGQHADSVNSLCITPDKQKLAAAGYQHIRIYDLNSNNPAPKINHDAGITKNITCVGFQSEGKWMYTTGEDARARIWDLRGKNACNRDFRTTAPINYAALHPNQTDLILCDDNGAIHVWNLRNNKNEYKLVPDPEATIQCVAVDSSGSFLAAVNNMGRCYVWSLSREPDALLLEPLKEIAAHTRYALKCKFSPDSSLLATTSADQTVSIWRTKDFSLFQRLKYSGGQKWVWDCAFSNDSKFLITASSDNLARLWCIEDGKIEQEYQGHQKAVTALAFADG